MSWYPLDDQEVSFGDCRELLKDLEADSVDLIIADPPYAYKSAKQGGMVCPTNGCDSNSLRSVKGKGRMEYGDKVVVLEYKEWLVKCYRVLKPQHSILIFEHPSTMGELIPAILAAGFKIKWTCVLNITDRQPVSSLAGKRPWSRHDVMVWAFKEEEPFAGGDPITYHAWPVPADVYRTSQISASRGALKGFPGKKPIPMLEEWIEWLSPPGGLVLDPFLGSGSTLKAAWIRKRRGLGFEIEEERKELIVERLTAGQKRLDLTSWMA